MTTHEGPVLERLTRRLSECPNDFLLAPALEAGGGRVHTGAVVSDLLRDLGGGRLSAKQAAEFGPPASQAKRDVLRLVLVAAWLLHDEWFRAKKRFSEPAREFLSEGLDDLARLVPAREFVTVPERREELARLVLAALDLRPKGETLEQAEDRLSSVDTVETKRMVEASKKQQARARAILEAMKKKAAQEAAAKTSRE